MKIVILDPYFETLGGGEKVLVVLAQHLSHKHQVEILVKQPVDVTYVQRYFNVDLSRVTFTALPKTSMWVRLIASRYTPMPGRWRSLIYDYVSLSNLRKIKMDLFINSFYQSSLPSIAPKSVYMCMFPQKLNPGNIYHSRLRRLYNRLTTKVEQRFIGNRKDAINSYSAIVANSRYTAGWIKKYWKLEPTIVYPVCDNMGPPDVKKNIILNVGRFFADNGSSHHKKQDELIKSFIKLNRSDWQLHLAGSTATDEPSKVYLKNLHDLAKGKSNIFIHPNMPYADILQLRRETAIYWHATGLGYDPDIFPENQEHFGMATAEAMSAGAVPIVYDSAGQVEVVTNNKNGLLWKTTKQLVELTSQVIDNPNLRQKLSTAAIKRAADFNRKAFQSSVDQLILEVSHVK